MLEPTVRTGMLVRAPIDAVFGAFVDPSVTTRFWFTRSDGRLEQGSRVCWEWEMYGVGTTVSVLEIEENRRILIEWDDPPAPVEWTFERREPGMTMVEITAWGFAGGSAESVLEQALDSMGGFTLVLAGLKAWLEHGIELRVIGDRHPEARLDSDNVPEVVDGEKPPPEGREDAERHANPGGSGSADVPGNAWGSVRGLGGLGAESAARGIATGADLATIPRVRRAELPDIAGWVALRCRLWPGESPTELADEGRTALGMEPALTVFIAEAGDEVVGFVEVGLRSYAEGCSTSPVPYIEGWYVIPEWRGRGVGGSLIRAAEEWCRSAGYSEMGSDALVDNLISHAAHEALGFQRVETIVVFRKGLFSDPALVNRESATHH